MSRAVPRPLGYSYPRTMAAGTPDSFAKTLRPEACPPLEGARLPDFGAADFNRRGSPTVPYRNKSRSGGRIMSRAVPRPLG
jgi:hypothetical protein